MPWTPNNRRFKYLINTGLAHYQQLHHYFLMFFVLFVDKIFLCVASLNHFIIFFTRYKLGSLLDGLTTVN
jgi:hypothetical protein